MEAESELDCSRATGIGCPQEGLKSPKNETHTPPRLLTWTLSQRVNTLGISVLLMRGRPSIRIIAWKIFISRVSVAGASSSSLHHHSCAKIDYVFYLNLKICFSIVRSPSV
jgi:hypothetical protein